MALKQNITKAEYEKLSADLKAEYNADGDNYTLDVIGLEDVSALKNAKTRESAARKEAESKVRELQGQLDSLNQDDVRRAKDISVLEKEWQGKTKDIETKANEKVNKLQAFAREKLIDGTAMQIAAKISTVPVLMSKAIKERLSVDFEGDAPVLKIMGADGKVAADMDLTKLEQEFVANKEFSSIIVGSKASGGGAGKGSQQFNNGGAGNNQSDKPVPLSQMNPVQLAAHLKAKAESQE